MRSLGVLLTTASATLLVVAAVVPASALDIGLGGNRDRGRVSVSAGSTDDGGTRVGVRAGRASVGAKIGGDRNIASASVGAGSRTVNANVGTDRGRLVSLSNGNRTTTGSVNLGLGGGRLGNTVNNTVNGVTGPVGRILDGTNVGLPGSPGAPGAPGAPGGVTPGGVSGAISGMSSSQVAALKVQCVDILSSPRRFDRELVSLCRILQRL